MLKNRIFIIILLSISLFSGFAYGQKRNIEITKLTDQVYRLTSKIPYPANFLAFVSKDGVLLIDSGQKATGHELKAVLKEIAPKNSKIIYLINTHAHIDHTGGNLSIAGEPIIIGSNILKKTLQSYSYVLYEFPDTALPQISFENNMILEFGGEIFKLYSIPGSHDKTDIIVHLVKSKIVCMGDISYGMSFPSIDGYTGNFLNYPEVIDKAISLIPNDVVIVSGHGSESNIDQLKKYKEMISKTIALVKGEMAIGNDIQAMIDEDLLKEWSSFGQGVAGNRNSWIWKLANAGPSNLIGSLCGEMYKVLVHENADKAILKYFKLKKEYPNGYPFVPGHLNRVGYWLLRKNRTKDAVKIFQLMVKEFSKAWYAYDSLGEGYMKDGNKKKAIKNYKKSLKLNPKNKNAIQKLKELRRN